MTLETKRACHQCGYEEKEGELPFGHDDFYCPECRQETLGDSTLGHEICGYCGESLFSHIGHKGEFIFFCARCLREECVIRGIR